MKYFINQPFAIHELGRRSNQEDALYPHAEALTAENRLFILCDGMGGHQHGEVASQTVCEALSTWIAQHHDTTTLFSDEMLTQAMQYAYDRLDSLDTAEGEKKMGTTLVFVYLHAGGITAAHIGDSRYYHIRGDEHRVVYRSKDHSLVYSQFEAGTLSLKQLQEGNHKNVLLRAVMPHNEERDMPDIVHIKDVQPGDCFFLCSDGVLENLSDDELVEILTREGISDEERRQWLIRSTDDSADNHTAIALRIESVMHERIDNNTPDDEQQAILANKVFLAEQQPTAVEEEEENEDETTFISDSATSARMQPTPTLSTPRAAAPPTPPKAIQAQPQQTTTMPTSKAKKNNYRNIILLTCCAVLAAALIFLLLLSKSDKQAKKNEAPEKTIAPPKSSKTRIKQRDTYALEREIDIPEREINIRRKENTPSGPSKEMVREDKQKVDTRKVEKKLEENATSGSNKKFRVPVGKKQPSDGKSTGKQELPQGGGEGTIFNKGQSNATSEEVTQIYI